MITVNAIMVFNESAEKILLCRRLKDPYKGLSNLVGGKVDDGEENLEAAYRELFEETGITSGDIVLKPVVILKYFHDFFGECILELYTGKLSRHVEVYGDENPLYWCDVGENYFDMEKYAGDGIIGHLLQRVRLYWDEIF